MRPLPHRSLPPLPAQPRGVPWPTETWPEADPTELGADAGRLGDLLDELVTGEHHPDVGLTYGAAVVAGGRLVAERYGRRVVQDLRSLGDDPPHEDVTADSELLSWSMAKSITHLAVGAAIDDGALEVHDPVGDPQWQGADDPRAAITWDDLLAMRPGLAWTEEYYDLGGDRLPDVVSMLFGEGAQDMAAFAASFPLTDVPGSDDAYRYSSGTTNIVAANLQRRLGLDAAAMDRFLHERILDPIGMATARAEFDPAGTFIGSSYVHATLRDWCRFGLLALRGGRWEDRQLVPDGWIDHGRAARSWEPSSSSGASDAGDEGAILHGAHWWTWDRDDVPFGAHGFEGQRVICFPTRDLVVVRFGKQGGDASPALNAFLGRIAACFPER